MTSTRKQTNFPHCNNDNCPFIISNVLRNRPVRLMVSLGHLFLGHEAHRRNSIILCGFGYKYLAAEVCGFVSLFRTLLFVYVNLNPPAKGVMVWFHFTTMT